MENRLKEILCTVFDIPAEEIQDQTGPESVGLWDSLNHLRMVSEIEKRFRIRLTVKEIRSMITYARIREIVGNHLQESAR